MKKALILILLFAVPLALWIGITLWVRSAAFAGVCLQDGVEMDCNLWQYAFGGTYSFIIMIGIGAWALFIIPAYFAVPEVIHAWRIPDRTRAFSLAFVILVCAMPLLCMVVPQVLRIIAGE